MLGLSAFGLTPILVLAALSFAATPETKPAEKPALTVTLINNSKKSYSLNPTQSGEAFRKSISDLDKLNNALPTASAVNLTLRISNPTNKEITIILGGDQSRIDFTLNGQGAITDSSNMPQTANIRQGKPLTLAPGKTHDIKFNSLTAGFRDTQCSYFTEPGDYKLSATLTALFGVHNNIVLTSDPITITVTKPEAK